MSDDNWMTYAEAGRRLGISAIAARSLARRHDWPRQIPNKPGAPAKILVPADRLTDHPAGRVNGHPTTTSDHPPTGDRLMVDQGPTGPTDHPTGTLVDHVADRVIDRESDHMTGKMAGLLIMIGAMQQTIETQRSELMTAKAAFDAKEGEFRKIQTQLIDEISEQRRLIGMLTEKLTARRRWWPWRQSR
jgi:hypothetical protein